MHASRGKRSLRFIHFTEYPHRPLGDYFRIKTRGGKSPKLLGKKILLLRPIIFTASQQLVLSLQSLPVIWSGHPERVEGSSGEKHFAVLCLASSWLPVETLRNIPEAPGFAKGQRFQVLRNHF